MRSPQLSVAAPTDQRSHDRRTRVAIALVLAGAAEVLFGWIAWRMSWHDFEAATPPDDQWPRWPSTAGGSLVLWCAIAVAAAATAAWAIGIVSRRVARLAALAGGTVAVLLAVGAVLAWTDTQCSARTMNKLWLTAVTLGALILWAWAFAHVGCAVRSYGSQRSTAWWLLAGGVSWCAAAVFWLAWAGNYSLTCS